nr:PREDICTED: transmembrane emp24 domain-containing protein p24delta8-like [Daucus carota subsp. sativus]
MVEWVTMLLAFSLSNISLLQQTVDFEWKSAIAAKVWTNVAKKGLVNAIAEATKDVTDGESSENDMMGMMMVMAMRMIEMNLTS